MNGSGFDTLARRLTPGHSRRDLTRFLSGVAVAGPLALLGPTAPVVKAGKKKKKKRLTSPDGPTCATCPTCPSGMTDLGNGSCARPCVLGAGDCFEECSCIKTKEGPLYCVIPRGCGAPGCSSTAECPRGSVCMAVCSGPIYGCVPLCGG